MIIRIILFFVFCFSSLNIFSQNIFDIGIRNIQIFFSEPNWDDTLDLYYSNNLGQRLIADSIIIDGEVDEDVGIKYKGNSSYNANNIKNPLNIKLDYMNNGQSIDSYNVLKLSNGFKDPSFVREILSYEIAREYMPAPKATYANVSINGNLIGLYVCVQSIDDDFTNENFYERKGPFFKAENTNISVPAQCSQGPLGIWEYYNDTNCYQRAYEMQSTDDWYRLSEFLDTVNNHFSYIEKVLDIDRTLWFMAFENLFVCLDGPINSIPHNFYLFQDNNKRFSPIIWDMNQAFGTFTNNLPPPVANQDLQQLDIFHESSNSNNIMISKIFSSDQYKKMYVAHMKTIVNEFIVNDNYSIRAMELQQIINSTVSNDPNLFYSYSDFVSNINTSIGNNIGLTELMNERVSFLQSLSEYTATPPTINNISTVPTQVLPHTSFYVTAEVTNSDYVYLGYRYNFSDKFNKIEMFDNGNNGDGIAGDGIFGVALNADARDIQYYIYAENINAGIFSPQRAEHDFHQIPVVSGLVINEVMASNTSSVADQDGEYDDWVELYNGGLNPINLSGFHLSDNENILDKWTFPNITIQPNEYLIVWCDTAGSTQNGLHTTYRLSSDQEEVYLTDPSGVVIDAIHYVNMPSNISYARVPNGIGAFRHQEHTYNSNNGNATDILINKKINTINVYPNPSSNIIYVEGSENNLISVYNIYGQNIYTAKNTKKIDINSWKNGIYFVKSNNQIIKFIKQ